MRLITLILLAVVLGGAEAQDGLSAARDIINLVPSPLLFCRLTRTTTILGYNILDTPILDITRDSAGLTTAPAASLTTASLLVPVYANKCVGICISIITQPRECRPRYQRIYVKRLAGSLVGGWVNQVVGCDCKPKQCTYISSTGATVTREHGTTAIDACERRCTCSYGQLINCCRQRKDFVNGMTITERLRYINTVKTASTNALYKPDYDSLITLHQTLFGAGIHGGSTFFPWHRWYILQLENLLRRIDCRVTVPYWDWSKDAASPWTSTLWNVAYLGPSGSGSGNCVQSGPFAFPGWSLPGGACLRRTHSGGVGTVANVASIFAANPNASQFNSFRNSLENGGGMHGAVHCAVGGTMCTGGAAAAPEFFLHHCFIDKKWNDWQSISAAHRSAWSGTNSSYFTNMPTLGSWVASSPAQMADIANQVIPGDASVSVCYINPSRFNVWLDIAIANPAFLTLDRMALAPVFGNPTVVPDGNATTTLGELAIKNWVLPMNMTADEVLLEERKVTTVQDQVAPHIISEERGKGSWSPVAREFAVNMDDEFLDKAFSAPDTQIITKGCIDSEQDDTNTAGQCSAD